MLAHWGMWPGQLEIDLFDSSVKAESEWHNYTELTQGTTKNDYC